MRGTLAIVTSVAGSMLCSTAMAQLAAPTSAQVWDVRFVVDAEGPFAQGPSATAVGITMVARVGILPGTWNQANHGINRVGGAGSPTSGFRVVFSDPLTAGMGLGQGTVGLGPTDSGPFPSSARSYGGVASVDTSGNPIAGAYLPFREAFTPGGLPSAGSNDNPFNGASTNPAMGSPILFSVTLSRSRGWLTVPEAQGAATVDAAGNFLTGELAPVYRFLYVPQPGVTTPRPINVMVLGMSARYIFQLSGDLGSSGGTFAVPEQAFTFQVPGPGAGALAALAGLAGLRRRRRCASASGPAARMEARPGEQPGCRVAGVPVQRAAAIGALAGSLVGGAGVLAQAPASAQVWDVVYVADPTGPFAPGPSASQVGITMYARVGILPNTALTGTTNFGVSRVGGTDFRMTVIDQVAAAMGASQGALSRGETATNPGAGAGYQADARALNDTEGRALDGHFAPFRGAFNPQADPLFLGSNDTAFNGQANNTATGSPFITNVVGSRSLNFGSEGTLAWGNALTPTSSDPVAMIGDYVPVYRAYYFPSPVGGQRIVTLRTSGTTARYVFAMIEGQGVTSAAVAIGDHQCTFTVPAPGAGLVMALGGVALARRRRA